MLRVYLFDSQSFKSKTFELGIVNDFSEAESLIEKLDRKFTDFANTATQEDWRALPETDILNSYEGGELYADEINGKKRTFMYLNAESTDDGIACWDEC